MLCIARVFFSRLDSVAPFQIIYTGELVLANLIRKHNFDQMQNVQLTRADVYFHIANVNYNLA